MHLGKTSTPSGLFWLAIIAAVYTVTPCVQAQNSADSIMLSPSTDTSASSSPYSAGLMDSSGLSNASTEDQSSNRNADSNATDSSPSASSDIISSSSASSKTNSDNGYLQDPGNPPSSGGVSTPNELSNTSQTSSDSSNVSNLTLGPAGEQADSATLGGGNNSKSLAVGDNLNGIQLDMSKNSMGESKPTIDNGYPSPDTSPVQNSPNPSAVPTSPLPFDRSSRSILDGDRKKSSMIIIKPKPYPSLLSPSIPLMSPVNIIPHRSTLSPGRMPFHSLLPILRMISPTGHSPCQALRRPPPCGPHIHRHRPCPHDCRAACCHHKGNHDDSGSSSDSASSSDEGSSRHPTKRKVHRHHRHPPPQANKPDTSADKKQLGKNVVVINMT